MTDPREIAELADHITLAIRDRVFDPDDFLRWLSGRCSHESGLMAQVVMRLASWCPPDQVSRDAHAVQVLTARGDAGAIPKPCVLCQKPMVTRTYRGLPGMSVTGSKGMCATCSDRVWREAKAGVS